MHGPIDRLRQAADLRAAAGLTRVLRPRGPDFDGLLDLASNDYLGLCRDPRLTEAAVAATREWGTGATGSRLVTGSTRLHHELEERLAAFTQAPVRWCSPPAISPTSPPSPRSAGAGWSSRTRATTPRSSTPRRLARARVVVTPHGDVAAVEEALATRSEENALVVTDAGVLRRRRPRAARGALRGGRTEWSAPRRRRGPRARRRRGIRPWGGSQSRTCGECSHCENCHVVEVPRFPGWGRAGRAGGDRHPRRHRPVVHLRHRSRPRERRGRPGRAHASWKKEPDLPRRAREIARSWPRPRVRSAWRRPNRPPRWCRWCSATPTGPWPPPRPARTTV